jgi:hypothetical protein
MALPQAHEETSLDITVTTSVTDDGYDYAADPEGRRAAMAAVLAEHLPFVNAASAASSPRLDPAAAAVAAVLEQHPSAVSFGVTSSDQGGYGYYYRHATLADGTRVDEEVFDEERYTPLEEDERITDLDWGVFGDKDSDSTFDVSTSTGRIIR